MSWLKGIVPRIYLQFAKRHQAVSFNVLRKDFGPIYTDLRSCDIHSYTMGIWDENLAKLERAFLPSPPFNFLRQPIIKHTMFVDAGGRWLKEELAFLKKKATNSDLACLLQEDYVGLAPIMVPRYMTSHNSIHHLYHLFRFSEKTETDFEGIDVIVEWGGGYGNLAKIIMRLKKGAGTYIIIDLPMFSCIQWLYLSSVLGSEKVNLVRNVQDKIQKGRINLLPICFLDHFDIQGSLFISTWALNESSKYSQDYVIERNWFNAEHILLAYQNRDDVLPDSERIGMAAEAAGAQIEDISFLPDHHYAFR